MGIRFHGGREAFLQSGLAGAIGTVEVRPLDLTAGYAAIANGGAALPPRMILEVRDASGTTIYQAPTPEPIQAISPQAAYITTNILMGNTEPSPEPDLGGEARAAQRTERLPPAGGGQDRDGERGPRPRDVRLPRPAGRSGRAGARRRHLDGQQRPPEPAAVVGQGGDVADGRGACLRAYVRDITAGTPNADFPIPDGLVAATIDAWSGGRPGPGPATGSRTGSSTGRSPARPRDRP